MELSQLDYITVKTVQTLKKLGIETVMDLLFYYPTKFDDYTIIPYEEAEINKNVTIAGIVQGKPNVANVKSNLSVMNFYCDVDDHKVRITIFNRHFLRTKIHYGKYVRLTGKFDDSKKKFVAAEIVFDELGNDINPIFNIKGVDDKKVLELKEKLFYDYRHELVEDLPLGLRDKYHLISIEEAIRFINIPETIEETQQAVYRIKFEELLKYQLKVKYMLYQRKNHPEGIAILYDCSLVKAFIQSLPYTLTADQRVSLEAILQDLSSNYKMNRLLQGEVGSGKTVVAAIALYAVTTAGYQGAIMVPTEVLAYQHYQTFTKLFEKTSINVSLLTSSISAKEKKDILNDLQNGTIDLMIGTHSLFQKDVSFFNLGLVVTDEEHRFGVRQRVSMVGKGYLIDHLKMSATPIPRTLAISILGDSDISIIKTLPGNKKEVITQYINYDERDRVFVHIKDEVNRGRQVYIITPMIEESETMDLKNAVDVYENTTQYYQGFCRVGLIHGKLKTEEKEAVMRQFTANEIQILVATSVIEVGVNVVNATTMVILDADRFGIAQLHQMRGRVRRSDYQATCFLISKSTVESSIKRLKLIEENSDGFVLAEEDLLIRGQGDIFGEKQSGLVNFKMANIITDKEMLEEVNLIAEDMIESRLLFDDQTYENLLTIAHHNYEEKKENLE
ncbi:MAG: ATP-dependent DNA helicase RecG [Bacilli bacterium]